MVTRDVKNRPIERYQFSMNWFDMDQPFKTSCYFTDEQLDLVSLTPGWNRLTAKEMQEQLSLLYGEPHKKNLGPYGLDCVWLDEQRGMQLELIPEKKALKLKSALIRRS